MHWMHLRQSMPRGRLLPFFFYRITIIFAFVELFFPPFYLHFPFSSCYIPFSFTCHFRRYFTICLFKGFRTNLLSISLFFIAFSTFLLQFCPCWCVFSFFYAQAHTIFHSQFPLFTIFYSFHLLFTYFISILISFGSFSPFFTLILILPTFCITNFCFPLLHLFLYRICAYTIFSDFSILSLSLGSGAIFYLFVHISNWTCLCVLMESGKTDFLANFQTHTDSQKVLASN